MKAKFTLFIAASLFIAGMATAQSNLQAINPETHIYGLSTDAILESTTGIKNNGSASMSVLVQRYVIYEVPNSTNYICWGTGCYGETTSLTPFPVTINPGETDYSFKGDYKPNGTTGISYIKYCYFDENNASDSICLIMTYQTGLVGLAENSQKKAEYTIFPNPATTSATLNYTLNGLSSPRLIVRDMLGKTVRERMLDQAGTQVTLDFNDLQPGVYFYTITSEGKPGQSKRLVISR